MRVEDDALKSLMNTSRLDEWQKTVLDLAINDHQQKISEEAEKAKNMQDAAEKLMLIENTLKRNESSKSQTLLHLQPRLKLKAKITDRRLNYQNSIKQS